MNIINSGTTVCWARVGLGIVPDMYVQQVYSCSSDHVVVVYTFPEAGVQGLYTWGTSLSTFRSSLLLTLR